MNWTVSDPSHLLDAINLSLAQGGSFLKSRVAPDGPIGREPNVDSLVKSLCRSN